MKRILLGTTMLIGAASFAAAAHADTPRITLGGTSDFQLGWTNEDRSDNPGVTASGDTDAGFRSGAFRTETELNVKIDAKTDGGLGYGGQIDIVASGHNDQDNETGNGSVNATQIPHSWLYTSGAWGRTEMGSTVGVTRTMKVDASSIAHATGGIDGDFDQFMSSTTGRIIASPDLFLDYGTASVAAGHQFGDETQEAINKVNYYTPKFAGFQAGVSYMFDSKGTNRGIFADHGDTDSGEAENVWLGGLSWEGKYSNVGLAVAATGEWGSAESTTQEDLRTWNVGAKANYMGFSLAGSYGNLGDSLSTTAVNGDAHDAHYWTAGLAYETGPFGASVTWIDSQVELDGVSGDNNFDNLSVGVDYKLAPGFTPYAEVNFVQVDPTGTANDNDATVFIAGTTLSF
jgi:hypothetical protein